MSQVAILERIFAERPSFHRIAETPKGLEQSARRFPLGSAITTRHLPGGKIGAFRQTLAASCSARYIRICKHWKLVRAYRH